MAVPGGNDELNAGSDQGPPRLLSIAVSQYGPLRDLEMFFEPDLTVIAGRNGVGKTSLIKCIEQGMAMPPDEEDVVHRPVKAVWLDDQHGVVICYSESSTRVLDPYGVGQTKTAGATLVDELEAWLVLRKDILDRRILNTRSFDHEDKSVIRLNDMLEQAAGLREISTTVHLDLKSCSVQIKKDDRTSRREQLSSGEMAVFDMVVGLSFVLEQHQVHPVPGRGPLIIIDEIESHLHPAWQRKIIGMMMRSFPQAQFIVITHSPQVIGSVDARCVRLLRHDDSGRSVVSIPAATRGIDSNYILEALMDADDRDPTAARLIDSILHRISVNEFEAAEADLDALRSVVEGEVPLISTLSFQIQLAKRKASRQ